MIINKNYLTINKFSRPAKKRSKTTKVAVHYVGNANSSAIANRNYFENLKKQAGTSKLIYASSHYLVGLNGEIIQCVPEDEIAYTTNDANAYSIGIEVCHPKTDGVFTDATRKALVELVADICKRYNLNPMDDIIRHYDVTGKDCPRCWASNTGSKYTDFVKFKNEVNDFINKKEYALSSVSVDVFGDVRVVDGINIDGYNYVKLRDLECDRIKIGWDGKNVLVNGRIFSADGILHNDYNYIKIRQLETIGISVEWNDTTKMITLR